MLSSLASYDLIFLSASYGTGAILLRVKNDDHASIVKSNKIKVLEEFSLERFCINFSKAVLNEN